MKPPLPLPGQTHPGAIGDVRRGLGAARAVKIARRRAQDALIVGELARQQRAVRERAHPDRGVNAVVGQVHKAVGGQEVEMKVRMPSSEPRKSRHDARREHPGGQGDPQRTSQHVGSGSNRAFGCAQSVESWAKLFKINAPIRG